MVDTAISNASERAAPGLTGGHGNQPSGGDLDDLDKRIVAALQMNPRGSWRQIATKVGTSESTVGRRAERLIEMGVVRITAFSERVSPGFPVLVQFTCTFAYGPEVARQLAERDDVRFVSFVTGPFDVVAELIISSHRRLATIMLRELPKIPGIRATTTETVLRTFKRSYDWSRDLLGSASVDVAPPPEPDDHKIGPVLLDQTSQQILEALKEDGRAGYAALAARCGISESMARYRVDHLLTKAGIRIVTIIDPQLLGYDTQLLIWLRVDLARREEAAAALVAHRAVRFVAATSGYSDLVCETYLRSQEEVYDFSSHVLGRLPGVQQVNMATELLTVKRSFLRVDNR
jgi:DNA-binding Lrp family transcriptional regulator